MKSFVVVLLFGVTLMSALVQVLNTGSASVPSSVQQPPEPEKDPATPINKPDYFAWQLFVRVNAPGPYQTEVISDGKKVATNNAMWETWASDHDTFPEIPDPNKPPPWPGKDRPRRMILRPRALRPKTKHLEAVVGNEEVYRNKSAFTYIMDNQLYYTQGLAAAFKNGLRVSFPTDSIEVKANWIKISPDDKAKYHWNYDDKGTLYGLVAMHISSKALPNWFWATFEWVGNPGRSDFIGSRDTFGVKYATQGKPWFQVPVSEPANLGKAYPSGEVTDALKKLFDDAGYKADWKAQWMNYRLKGSQVDFADSTGVPTLLGNSVTEAGFVPSASCITCHSRAAVNSQGRNVFGTGFKPILPGNDNNPQSYNGYPDPSWFWQISDSPDPVLKNLQVDFVWAIPLFARPAKQ
jgi:hypothetical protein